MIFDTTRYGEKQGKQPYLVPEKIVKKNRTNLLTKITCHGILKLYRGKRWSRKKNDKKSSKKLEKSC